MRLACLFALSAFTMTHAAAAAAPQEVAEKAADDRDKIVCKRFVETGSLVKGYRSCKTKWEWERERENLRTLNVTDSCRARGSGGACDP